MSNGKLKIWAENIHFTFRMAKHWFHKFTVHSYVALKGNSNLWSSPLKRGRMSFRKAIKQKEKFVKFAKIQSINGKAKEIRLTLAKIARCLSTLSVKFFFMDEFVSFQISFIFYHWRNFLSDIWRWFAVDVVDEKQPTIWFHKQFVWHKVSRHRVQFSNRSHVR